MSKKTIKTGVAAMRDWDESWKGWGIPKWLKKFSRANPRAFDSDLFDHWGSIRFCDSRALVTQPYGFHDEQAEKFAREAGCNLTIQVPGPWYHTTRCYIFTPKTV